MGVERNKGIRHQSHMARGAPIAPNSQSVSSLRTNYTVVPRFRERFLDFDLNVYLLYLRHLR